MKLAVLIQCHTDPELINRFLEIMRHPQVEFFLHIDKKSDITEKILRCHYIHILPDDLRVNVRWGGISQVEATLRLVEYAQNFEDYDFFWLCSGQDFPIKPVNEIVQWFEDHSESDFVELWVSRNNGINHSNNLDKRNDLVFPEWLPERTLPRRILKRLYIELTGGYNNTFRYALRKNTLGMKFYFGSSWVCLTKRTIKWMTPHFKRNGDYFKYYSKCICPDESYFQTLVMNSPYSEYRSGYLHYVDFPNGANSPRYLTMDDYHKLKESHYLMGRKFSWSLSKDVIQEIIKTIHRKDGYNYKRLNNG